MAIVLVVLLVPTEPYDINKASPSDSVLILSSQSLLIYVIFTYILILAYVLLSILHVRIQSLLSSDDFFPRRMANLGPSRVEIS